MKILALTYKSITFELEKSSSLYECDNEFDIYLNGAFVRKERKNVFSLFGLKADCKYSVNAAGESARFKLPPIYAEVNVVSFGAKGDGITDDTPAFTAAINCLPKNSALYVPAGIYFLKPLFLKSGTTVYLEKGAILLANPNREEYPVLPALVKYGDRELNIGTWQGEEADCFASLITAYNLHNIKIIGEGIIDCNAPSGDWYVNHRVKRGAWRPRGMFFNRCKNVLVQGVTVKNTPSWNIHPYFCKNVSLLDLYLENPPSMPTTDGIDADCCNGVNIAGVKISVGDDCIAIKSGTLDFAKKYNTPCRNIIIRNCCMLSGHGGVVFGSELSGGIKNVNVAKSVFFGTDRGFRIKTRRGRGRIGTVGGVNFSDIKMQNVKVPFVINMYYNMGDENGHTEYVWTTEKLPVDERTPRLGSFTFKNMECSGTGYCAGAFYGLPESPIESVAFNNVKFSYDKDCSAGEPDMREKNSALKNAGLDFHFVKKVLLKKVCFEGQNGEKILLDNVQKIIQKEGN